MYNIFSLARRKYSPSAYRDTIRPLLLIVERKTTTINVLFYASTLSYTIWEFLNSFSVFPYIHLFLILCEAQKRVTTSFHDTRFSLVQLIQAVQQIGNSFVIHVPFNETIREGIVMYIYFRQNSYIYFIY